MIKLILGLLVGLSALQAATQAPVKEKKSYTIYMVTWRGFSEEEKGFVETLRKKNINFTMIQRDCQQNSAKIPEFVKEIKAQKPDLVYAHGTAITHGIVGTHAERNDAQFIADIPVVAFVSADPVESHVVATLENSGRNLALISDNIPFVPQLTAWREYFGKKQVRIAYIYHPSETKYLVIEQKLKELTTKEELVVDFYPLTKGPKKSKPNEREIEQFMKKIAETKADFLYVPNQNFLGFSTKIVTDAAKKHKIPVFSLSEMMVRNQEAMFGLACHAYYFGELAADYAAKILEHTTNPGTLPVVVPRRYVFLLSKNVHSLISDHGKRPEIAPPLDMIENIEVIES